MPAGVDYLTIVVNFARKADVAAAVLVVAIGFAVGVIVSVVDSAKPIRNNNSTL